MHALAQDLPGHLAGARAAHFLGDLAVHQNSA
jgi:hypothetical protein